MIVELLIVTVIAVGFGVLFALIAEPDAVGRGRRAKSRPAASRLHDRDRNLVDLPPIVTNIGSPADIWVRVEASIVFDGEDDAAPRDPRRRNRHRRTRLSANPRYVRNSRGRSDWRTSARTSPTARVVRSDGKVSELILKNLGGAMKRRLQSRRCSLVLVSRPRGPDDRPQHTDTERRSVGDGARRSDGRDTDGALDRARSADHGHELHALHRRAFVSAFRAGLQSTPANLVLTSLALFMTLFVMAPTFDQAWQNGLKPMMDNTISQEQAFDEITGPFREFMLAQVREKDIALFEDLRKDEFEVKDGRRGSRVLIPAFMISELRRGFEIGFMIVLPFLVIDMIVATLTMSMGMMMLPPTVLSLPAKLLFFVMIDGGTC